MAAMVNSYDATVAQMLPVIRAAIEAADAHALEPAAHELKGVSANLGVRCVHRGATGLVALARSGTVVGGEAILEEIEGGLGPGRAALRTLLARLENS
jgi:HPt (histidine-containing phosphotransfer) domain-containing protein